MDDAADLRGELGRLPGRPAVGGDAGGSSKPATLTTALAGGGSATATRMKVVKTDATHASLEATTATVTIFDGLGALSAELPIGTIVLYQSINGVKTLVGWICP